MKIVLVSGGFDPLHVGHVRLIQEASKYGRVWVALNSDEWLIRKKGYAFMSWEQRKEILLALSSVSEVVSVDDTDGSVCSAITELKPNCFVNGGDRISDNIPEYKLCRELDIEMIFNAGGGKIESSSKLVGRVAALKCADSDSSD